MCECEAVTAGEVQYAVENLTVNNLLDLRRRTRVGMGTCQGSCAPAVPPGCCNVFTPPRQPSRLPNSAIFKRALERHSARRPGDALRESEFTRWVYQGLCGLEKEHNHEI